MREGCCFLRCEVTAFLKLSELLWSLVECSTLGLCVGKMSPCSRFCGRVDVGRLLYCCDELGGRLAGEIVALVWQPGR